MKYSYETGNIKENKSMYYLANMITFHYLYNVSFCQYRSTYLKSMIEFISDLN